MGFKAGVAGVGEVAPSGEWVVGDKDGGWIKVESKEVSSICFKGLDELANQLGRGMMVEWYSLPGCGSGTGDYHSVR